MNNKKIGMVLLGSAGVLLLLFLGLVQGLNQKIANLGCYQNMECRQMETSLNAVHFAFGIFGFLFALGFFLIFFSKGEEAIVQRLEADTRQKLQEEKKSILLKGLDESERRVFEAVEQQQGITQNTLRLRIDLSKAKLSQVLSAMERKGLISRVPEKKTLAVFLKEGV